MIAKERVIKTLKDFGRLSTSRIAGIIGYNYSYTLIILKDLEKDKKVKKIEETNAVFWELRK